MIFSIYSSTITRLHLENENANSAASLTLLKFRNTVVPLLPDESTGFIITGNSNFVISFKIVVTSVYPHDLGVLNPLFLKRI